ncbi:MAG: CRISPR-associated protein Csx11 [Acidobacteria bacterium]|nr:CRISPR-associated protein Csx11 [Acidobacteriota bacterium]
MSNSKLDVLRQHHDALLLAELGALLHDVGKFCNLHVETHSEGGSRKWSNDHAYKAVVDNPGDVIRVSKAAAKIPKPDALNNVLNASSPKASDFLAQEFKAALEQSLVTLFGQTYTLAELTMLGTPGFATHQSRAQLLEGKDGWLPAVLGVCHNEAHHDKQEPAKGEGAQSWPTVRVSTAFGFEPVAVPVENSQGSLDNRVARLPTPGGAWDKKSLLDELSYGLGETRRPINEITLADWAVTVAALYKSTLATCVLEGQQRGIRGWASWKEKLIAHDIRWRLLRVNFDVLGLFAKAIKIADLLAYQNAVQQVCQSLKQLVEQEYPLGNEVYRDTTGIYFTFPDHGLLAELAEEVRRRVEDIEPELAPRIAVRIAPGSTATDQLKNLLHYQRGEAKRALVHAVDDENYTPRWERLWNSVQQGSEVCPVCRLRPMGDGEEACKHCFERRQSRINSWKDEPFKSIWLDEIADHNNRLALLVGKFDLDDWLSGDLVHTMLVKAVENNPSACVSKNPSPARLRRVWETCQRFWMETIEKQVLENHEYSEDSHNVALRRARLFVTPDSASNWKENVPYDGTVNGQPVSLVWRATEKHFVTIVNLQLVAGAAKTLQELQQWSGCDAEVGDPDNPRRRIPFKIEAVTPATHSWAQYRPHLTLLTSPDQFLALIPASDSLEITKTIREEYLKQFGKVQNRLPLFLGLIFFQRKMPLMAVMDTARRMLKQVHLEEEPWTVECSGAAESGEWQLRLGRDKQRLHLDVPIRMGDGATEDVWYPYFFVDGSMDVSDRPNRFQHSGRWLVHVKDLREGDPVRIMPSRFAYNFLENTAQRFEFNPEKDAMLLDELPRLTQMWKEIREAPEMTNTSLQAIHSLFETKRVAWRVSEDIEESRKTFGHLVEATLKRGGLDGRISFEDVLSGRFSRCLDLHLKILKLRMQESEYERQPENAIA